MTDSGFSPGEDLPVYVISVAAELAGLHAQTLRTYDRLGLVVPGRAPGGGRRSSARDIALLRRRVVQMETERSSAALVVWRPRGPRS